MQPRKRFQRPLSGSQTSGTASGNQTGNRWEPQGITPGPSTTIGSGTAGNHNCSPVPVCVFPLGNTNGRGRLELVIQSDDVQGTRE